MAEYWEAITVIQAEQVLVDFKTGSYPWMKEKDKRNYINHFDKLANPIFEDEEIEYASADDFEKWLVSKTG